jgi:hypothetical protein
MKKLATLLLAAGMVVASTAPANAVDVKVDGRYRFSFMTGQSGYDGANQEYTQQRFRLGLTFAASENLSGYVQFQLGKYKWGTAQTSGGNTDGTDVSVRQSYIDWTVPGTAVKVRMGRHCLGLPNDAFGENAVMSSGYGTRDGIVVTAPVTDWLGVTALWTRVNASGADLDTNSTDDIYAAIANLKFNGFKADVYAAYATLDKDASVTAYEWNKDEKKFELDADATFTSADGSTLPDFEGKAYWVGFTSTMSYFDPFTLKLSAAFGEATADKFEKEDQKGWNVQAKASYALDFGTPVLGAWYFSGDDDRAGDGTMPHVAGAFTPTRTLHDGSIGLTGGIGSDMFYGNWGVQAGVEGVSFVKGLSHDFLVSYIQGTNKELHENDATYLTEDDSLVSFDLVNTYKIYKNLAAHLELAYIINDYATVRKMDDDAWRAGLTFDFKF